MTAEQIDREKADRLLELHELLPKLTEANSKRDALAQRLASAYDAPHALKVGDDGRLRSSMTADASPLPTEDEMVARVLEVRDLEKRSTELRECLGKLGFSNLP